MEIIRVRLCGEKTKGCERAPIEILKKLRDLKGNEKGKEINVDKLSLEEIHVDLKNLEEAHYLIFENSKEIFERNFKAFFIGGDGSIDYSVVRAFKKIENNPLLIIFDAHADCRGDEKKEITNRNWLRKLIESGFEGDRIILIGMRNVSEEEMEFLKKNKIVMIRMDLLQEDLLEVSDLVMERARNASGFYVSVDIDCLDPAFAPGSVDLEPGGLTSRDLIYFIKRLVILDNFRGASIVEVDVKKDLNEMSIKLGAKLLGEML